MRTDVLFSFDAAKIPGGPPAILGPAGCGPDVVEEIHEFTLWGVHHVNVHIRMDKSDKRLPVLLKLLEPYDKDPSMGWRDVYTEEELDNAPLVHMDGDGWLDMMPMSEGADMRGACPSCGAGARQTSPFLVFYEQLKNLEGRRAIPTFTGGFLVDDRLAEDLENLGVTGLSFRSVYAVMEDKRQVKLGWREVCAKRTLPRFAPSVTQRYRGELCPSCERSGYKAVEGERLRFAYRREDLAEIDDVNYTWEWFGPPTVLFPFLLCTPKVMHAIRDAGVTEFDWLAVGVE